LDKLSLNNILEDVIKTLQEKAENQDIRSLISSDMASLKSLISSIKGINLEHPTYLVNKKYEEEAGTLEAQGLLSS